MNQISRRFAALAAWSVTLFSAPAWCQPAQTAPPTGSYVSPQAAPGDAPQRPTDARQRRTTEERRRANLERRRQNEEKRLKAAAERRQKMEGRLRAAMSNLGFNDPTLQDALMTYIAQEEEERAPLRAQSRKVYQALRSGVPDAQIAILMSDWRSALAADKARHAQAQAALDAQIGYSKSPRLEAMLLLMGVVGDGPLLLPLGAAPRSPASAASPAVSAPTLADVEATQFDPTTGEPIYSPAQLEARRRFDSNGDGHLDREETRKMRAILTKPHTSDEPSPDAARPTQNKAKSD